MKGCVLEGFAGTGIRLAVLSVLVLALTSSSWAQAYGTPAQSVKAAAPATAPEMVASEAKPVAQTGQATIASKPKGTQEGIKVHGHWTVEIKNSDGKVVSRSEFENTLQSGGAFALADLISGQYTSAGIGIGVNLANLGNLSSNNATQTGSSLTLGAATAIRNISAEAGPCTGGENPDESLDSSNGCIIVSSQSSLNPTTSLPAYSDFLFPNLVVVAPSGNPFIFLNVGGGGQVMLSGSILTSAAATISDVETVFLVTNSCATPANCNPAVGTSSSYLAIFSAATLNGQNGLPNALPVNPGQLISITVVISFS